MSIIRLVRAAAPPLAVVAVLSLPALAQASPGWITPVATLSQPFSNTPQIAANASGDTVVAWATASGNGPIMESERQTNGSFSAATQPVFMSGGSDLNGSVALGSVGIDNSGTIYIFFISGAGTNSTVQANVATKPIGGSTWTVTPLHAAGGAGVQDAPTGPMAGAVSPGGQAIALWEVDHVSNFLASSYSYSVKPAGSNTWSARAAVPGTTGGSTSVHAVMDASGDAAALFGFAGNGNVFGATIPSGGSWTTMNRITTLAGGSSTASPPSLGIDSNGRRRRPGRRPTRREATR